MDEEHQTEIWPIKSPFYKNKIGLKIVHVLIKWKKCHNYKTCKFMFAVR